MKKLILGVVFGSAIAFNAFAANNNNPDVVIQGNAGSMHVSQCASVAGNCNNASINIEVGGNATINGSAVVVKGKDGADGKDGQRGEQGLKGEKGDRGQDGAAGTNGTNGKDGADGANGKDAYRYLPLLSHSLSLLSTDRLRHRKACERCDLLIINSEIRKTSSTYK